MDFREIPSVAKKASWGLKYTKEISDPGFVTGTDETDKMLLKNLIAFYCVLEGIFFYCGCPNMMTVRGDVLSAVDMSQVIMSNSHTPKRKNEGLTQQDIEWQEARRK